MVIVEKISAFLCLFCLFLFMAFPGLTSLFAFFQEAYGSLNPFVEKSVLGAFFSIFSFCDSGAHIPIGANFIRLVLLSGAIFWFLYPRKKQKSLLPVIKGGGVFFALLLMSCLFSSQIRDSLSVFSDYAAIFVAFLLSSGLSLNFCADNNVDNCTENASEIDTVINSKTDNKINKYDNCLLPLDIFHIAIYILLLAVFPVILCSWGIYSKTSLLNPVMHSSFFQPNMFAGFILIFWPMGLTGLFLTEYFLPNFVSSSNEVKENKETDETKETDQINKLQSKSNIKDKTLFYFLKGFFALFSSFAAVSLYFSFNRTAWILAVLSFLLCFVYAIISQFKKKRLKDFLSCFVVFIALCSLFIYIQAPLENKALSHAKERIENAASGQDTSLQARFEFYAIAVNMALDHPFLGVGPEGYHRNYPLYQTDMRWFGRYSHCLILDIASEFGLPCAVVFIVCVVLCLIVLYKKLKTDTCAEKILRISLFAGPILLLCHAQLDVDFTFIVLPIFAALSLGVALGTPSLNGENYPDYLWPKFSNQQFFSFGCLLLLSFNAYTMQGSYYYTLGKLADDGNQLEKAGKFYTLAADSDIFHGEYNYKAALALYKMASVIGISQSDLEKLKTLSQRAAKLDPTRASAVSLRGRVLEMTESFGAAIPYYQASLELDPKNFPASYTDCARFYILNGDINKAEELLNAAIKAFPEEDLSFMFDFRSKEIIQQLADVYFYLSKISKDNKKTYFKKAISLNKDIYYAGLQSADNDLLKAKELKRKGNIKEAKILLDKALTIYKDLYDCEPSSSLQNKIDKVKAIQ